MNVIKTGIFDPEQDIVYQLPALEPRGPIVGTGA